MKATAARPLLVVAAVLASGVAESQSATMMAPAPLESALCLAGNPAHVFANSSIDATGAKWVLNFGSQSAGRPGFCIDEDHCAMVAAGCPGINAGCPGPAPRKPAPAPAPVALLAGIQSQNCTENPAFCGFNQVQLDDCDQALLLSNATVDTVCRNASAQLTPINGSTCTLHFQGLRILQQSIAKLAQLGLAKAEEVVLTGFSHGGTMALLHADRVHAMIKAVAPGLKRFAAIPADGVHPRSRWGVVDWFPAICCAPYCNSSRVCTNTLDLLYAGMANVSNAATALPAGCRARHAGREWECMYLNETLSEIKTPAFLVNQLASIFDTQCNLAGSIIDMGQGFAAILQLKCITGEGPWHECFQYSDKCSGGPRGQVLGVIKPFQQQLIDETASFIGSAGNGAFYHSCHSGAYWYSAYQKPDNGSITFPMTSIWNQFGIGGMSMQQAITDWWHAPRELADPTAPQQRRGGNAVSQHVTVDCLWDSPPGRGTWLNDSARNNWGMSFCNPTCDGFPYY